MNMAPKAAAFIMKEVGVNEDVADAVGEMAGLIAKGYGVGTVKEREDALKKLSRRQTSLRRS